MFKIVNAPYIYLAYYYTPRNYLRVCFNIKHSLIKDNIVLEHNVIPSKYFTVKHNFVNTLYKFRELGSYV